MDIAMLTEGNHNVFALSILCRLQKQGDVVSNVVCKRSITYRKIKKKLQEEGIKYCLAEVWNRFIKRFQVSDYNEPYPNQYEYLNQLVSTPPSSIKEASNQMQFNLCFTKDINSENSVSFLKAAKPDLIIYAGGGIIRKPVIEIPRIGILNAHMGLLPCYRGMNVLEWSLFYDDQIGVTVHFIDEGIDTGSILLRRNIEIEEGDTIDSLRAKSFPISVEMFAEVISRLKTGQIDRIEQRKSEGKQYFVMHERLKDLVERKKLNN